MVIVGKVTRGLDWRLGADMSCLNVARSNESVESDKIHA